MNPPPILLVGPGDAYPSIDRFVRCLAREFGSQARVFQPQPYFARLAIGPARKWLAYLDKFVLFPRVLVRESRRAALVHLCDQSCAVYTPLLRGQPHLLNCNDLIAIRSALGEFPWYRPSWSGRQLQSIILRGIRQAAHITCLSQATRGDLVRLAQIPDERITVIPMGFHFPFARMSAGEAARFTARWIPDEPFVLHVGGNQWYKNRRGVVETFAHLLRSSPSAPNLVIVGAPDSPGRILPANLRTRVFYVADADDRALNAFYSQARALLFPSFCEGFGWPIIEAQACGCPVLTTNRAPMTEVGGSAALYGPADDPGALAQLLGELLAEGAENAAARQEAGYANAARFSTAAMISQYRQLYASLGRAAAHACVPALA